jgi:hypothetical protein
MGILNVILISYRANTALDIFKIIMVGHRMNNEYNE